MEFWKSVSLKIVKKWNREESPEADDFNVDKNEKKRWEAYDPESSIQKWAVGSEGSRWMYIGRMEKTLCGILCQGYRKCIKNGM